MPYSGRDNRNEEACREYGSKQENTGAAMSTAALVLETRLDLRAAGPLASEITAHRGGDLVLDAGGVEHLGALALQVIRAAARTWSTDGHVLTLEGASIALADQLSLLGFSPDNVTTWEGAE